MGDRRYLVCQRLPSPSAGHWSQLVVTAWRYRHPPVDWTKLHLGNLLGFYPLVDSQFSFSMRWNPKGSISRPGEADVFPSSRLKSLHSTSTLSLWATPVFCNRSSFEEVPVSIDLSITSTLTLQLMSNCTECFTSQLWGAKDANGKRGTEA